MPVPNRAALIQKTHHVLKKHYQPVTPPADRSVLEHLLYACCLENAKIEAADESFARLDEIYFDWNEVRVTTVSELSETMASLPDPPAAASRLKRVLQSVFETHYAFDLEFLKKENIGAAARSLAKYDGASPFAVAYVTQVAFGGHAIAVDQAALDTLQVLGVISESEARDGRVPGLERAVPKAQGMEFASLLHQLAADYHASPFSPRVRAILTEIAPDAKTRWPKRRQRKKAAPEPEAPAAAGPAGAGKSKPKGKPKAAAEKTAKAKKSKGTGKNAAKSGGKRAAAKSASSSSKSTKRLQRKKPR